MSTSPAQDGIYRIRVAEEALDLDPDSSKQVVLTPLSEDSATQKWNLVVQSGTFTATNVSNNLKLTCDIDDPEELSANGKLIVSSSRSTTWTANEEPSPGSRKFPDVSAARAGQGPGVLSAVLSLLYSNKVADAQKEHWFFEYVSTPPVVPESQSVPESPVDSESPVLPEGPGLPESGGSAQIQAGTSVTEDFVPSGIYSFHNVKYGSVINLPEEADELDAGEPQSLEESDSNKWVVTLSSNKKFTIKNAKSGQFAQKSADTDGVTVQTESTHVWVIKRVKGMTDAYQISAPGALSRVWGLQDGQIGTKVEFSRTATDSSTWWNIKKHQSIGGDEAGQNEIPTPIPNIIRPGDKGIKGNTLEITVPKNWSVVVTAVAFQNAINLINLKAAVGPLVDVYNFYNERSQDIAPLKIQNQTEEAYNTSADKGPIVLEFAFYGSLNPKKGDPFSLQSASFESALAVSSLDRSLDTRNFPDYRTYYITAMEGTTGNRALVTIQLTNKNDSANSNQPEKPKPGEVIPGYSETCDEARPNSLDQYLSKYDSVFLLDDSRSMTGRRWAQACKALHFIADEALQYDADGIGLLFLNSPVRAENLKGQDDIDKILDNVKTSSGTPTAARLDVVLREYIDKLDTAVNTPAYGKIKPLDLIVITDGEPSDKPQPVLEKWAAHLDAKKHHPNIVGIQFVQIGNDERATKALIKLTKGKVRSMVDTVPYNGSFTPEKLARVLLGAVMPSIRAKQNARL